MTRIDNQGHEVKMMGRKTIAKYFNTLMEKGLVTDGEDGYFYLTILEKNEAYLIEFHTLSKLLNVF